jgi:hypothetical protein
VLVDLEAVTRLDSAFLPTSTLAAVEADSIPDCVHGGRDQTIPCEDERNN